MNKSISTQRARTKSIGANRFAPTPSGALHMGSLYVAVIDFLDAKQSSRAWNLRIDDLDTPRVVADSIPKIINCMIAHGLEWHGNIVYQSAQSALYEDALRKLAQKNLIFHCQCSRKQLIKSGHVGQQGIHYPGTCRDNIVKPEALDKYRNKTLRVRVDDKSIAWQDQRLGLQKDNLSLSVGDFVIRRRDGIYAFHLATVVDDYHMGITHINRGMDLLGSASRQIYLQKALGYHSPKYAHFPLILQENGQKLAKQHHSPEVDLKHPVKNLQQILLWLDYDPKTINRCNSIEDCLDLGASEWDIKRALVEQVSLPYTQQQQYRS